MNLFILTPEEKGVVAFAVMMILVGVCVKEYRKRHPGPPPSIEVQKHPWMRKLPPLPSATPQPPDTGSSSTPRPKRSRKARTKTVTPVPAEEPEEADVSPTENEPAPP